MSGQTVQSGKKKKNSKPILPFPKQTLVFTCLHYKSFGNTVGKGETARSKQLILFQQCFQPKKGTFCHFH